MKPTTKVINNSFGFKKNAHICKNLKKSSVKIRPLCLGSLAAFFLPLLFHQSPLLAQDSLSTTATDSLKHLQELFIYGKKPSPFQPLVKVVASVSAPQITRMAVQNPQDLLRYLQGVDLRSRGPEGVQADLSLMGGSFDQSLVLLKGVNFTDPQTGHYSLNIPLSLLQIERVEVLHGPGAWSEGAIAYAGAINIQPKLPEQTALQAQFSAGAYGYLQAGGNLEYASKRLSGQIGGSYLRSDGYAHNTDFEIGNLYTNLRYRINKTQHLDFQAGAQDKAYGANSFYSLDYPDQYDRNRLILSSLSYHYESGRLQIQVGAYARRHWDRFELFRHGVARPDWYSAHNYHQSDVAGLGVQAAYRWKKIGTTILGADWRHEGILSTVLGHPIDKPKPAPFEEGIYYDLQKTRSTPAIFAKHMYQAAKWRLSAGAMGSRNSQFGTRIYGGLSAAYRLSPVIELYSWMHNTYRLPTFTDLYYQSPTQEGNSQLLPEEALALQVGSKYRNFQWQAEVAGFYRYGYRIIDWVRASESDQWQAQNLTNISSMGWDMNGSRQWERSWIQEMGLSYSYLWVRKDSQNQQSIYATDYLRHKAGAFVLHRLPLGLSARWDFHFQSRAGSYYDTKQQAELSYDPFLLCHLRLQWQGSGFRVYAEANNLFNTSYFDLGSLTQPGRWIKAGIQIDLKMPTRF